MIVNFTQAVVGEEAYVYVDPRLLSDHYCVFELDWFDERDGEVHLVRQRWKLLEEEELVLPDPIASEEE